MNSSNFQLKRLFPVLCLTASAIFTTAPQSANATVKSRIAEEINGNQVTQLPNSRLPMAQAKFDKGRVSAATKLEGISLYFNRTPAQEASLKALIAAQQNQSSPQFHKWLTPEQFGARFGMADSDIAKVQSWLEQQGFSVDSVARGKDMIRFSGSVGQVEQAFTTELHNYALPINGKVENHFAPSNNLSVPSALAGVVESVRNLDDFRPRSHVVLAKNKPLRPKPNFTGTDGSLFFAPGDIVTEYDIQTAYNAGGTGAGQTIAIVGQSEIAVSDIEAFQNAAGIAVKDPTLVLVPGTGNAAVSAGDETESDLDLEWSGAIAQGANVEFVYTGSSQNTGAFDAIVYAVDNKIGTIISSSYGECEADLGGSTLETTLEKATSFGQSVLSASGDDGSTDCFTNSSSITPAEEALSVDYPASSAYVTGVGGTEISQSNSAYETPGSAYWANATTSDVVSSVLQYIPEQAWNEDAQCVTNINEGYGGSPLCAGGGGASSLFSKPSWQTGVTGIPSDGHRDVPDVSLNAAIFNPGYLYCSSDQSGWQSDQAASCNSGFRDASSGELTAAGGTSFAAPIFAGMMAIINQQKGYTDGQGLANPSLYTLASNATTYASAFHDITSGNNDCLSGSSYCNGSAGFSTGTGYDQATGLGTIDLSNLVTAYPVATGTSLLGTTTTVSASNTAPALNASDTFTVTVAADSGTAIPTGSVSLTIDSGTPVTGLALSSNGTVTYPYTFTTSGTHTILTTYSGNSTFASSTGSVTVTVPVVSTGTGSFTLAATNLTIAAAGSGSSTITVTPAGGYTGTIDLSFDTSNDNALTNLCYEFATTDTAGDGTVIVSSKNAVTTTLSLDDNTADCAGAVASARTGKHALRDLRRTRIAKSNAGTGNTLPKSAPLAVAFAGLMLFGFLGKYARKFRTLAGVILLIAAGLAVTACGGSSGTPTGNPPAGTYTITVTGQDASSSTVPTATAQFTFTIQ